MIYHDKAKNICEDLWYIIIIKVTTSELPCQVPNCVINAMRGKEWGVIYEFFIKING